jgi:hypothetical protein
MNRLVWHVLFAGSDSIVLDDEGRLECPPSSLK